MTYITVSFFIIITLCASAAGNMYTKEYTRTIDLKQGTLQGIVAAWLTNRQLPQVAQYRGIPYAAPPVGKLRFMPSSGSPPSWSGTKYADSFGPVCPQKFPDIKAMTNERRNEFLRLQQYLLNQSEDCLYLNIYAPYAGHPRGTRRYPVLVFIHGESFEWNSGNPYDGSVLAAYGNVIVVTLNYRLGVLGFLKSGTEEYSESNFGLVDQIAALLWVKQNIAAFGGDPSTVTLFGHGTGAVCASLLMLSPMILQEHDKMLFQRVILMGGSALSDWALADNSRHVSYQLAQALNCPIQDDFAACLRKKRLDEILAAPAVARPYATRFGPVVDHKVVPNHPPKSMTTYNDIFKRFELLYGVTEIESIHLLSPDALQLGMLERDRDQELRKYFRERCEIKPEMCVTRSLAEYSRSEFVLDDDVYGYTGHEPDRASLARDALLDILSDARTVAPMVQMAKYHAAFNQQSYFYVFTHKTNSKEYIRDKSHTGEELPYVFGVPLGGPAFHFTDHYNDKERLFSEVIMTYFCNFAYTGDPNVPRKNEYYTLSPNDWIRFEVDWPEFDLNQQQYLQLGIPPYRESHYRDDKMKFWNEEFPEISHNYTDNSMSNIPRKNKPFIPIKGPPSWIVNPKRKTTYPHNNYENFHKPYITHNGQSTYGNIRVSGTSAPDNMMNNVVYGTVVNSPEAATPNPEAKNITTTIAIAIGSIFLLSNICLFLAIYIRRYKKKKLRNSINKTDEAPVPVDDSNEAKLLDGCNIMKIVSKSSRSDDTYEAVKTNQSGGKFQIPRQMSNSTIDAHTKVRDWITNEIVYKYSPRFLRRPRQGNDKFPELKPETNDNNSTLGRSPTRPVSPSDNFKNSRPPLLKSSSIPVQKIRKIEKVSVAIDATPSGRGNSVLAQQPIELTKSLDRPNFETPLRRSMTLDDFSIIQPMPPKQELRKSTTSINLRFSPLQEPTVIRIEHMHSKSDPVQEFNSRKLKTFDPNADVNVTSREDSTEKVPLTPEESLMTIKRRNFPKVLPDYPSREALAKKRRSMPVPNLSFLPIPEGAQPRSPTNKTFAKLPPTPPLRTTSTLSRKPNNQSQPVCQSAPMLAQEPPPSPEPEVTYNNLYFGPLIPKLTKTALSSSESSKLNTQPIYDSLRSINESDRKTEKPVAKTIITTDPTKPIKKVEPKVIIKPTLTKNLSDSKKNIPRVMVHDNNPDNDKGAKLLKPSQIPTFAKSKESSSSESTTLSEESDTGTVVKK